MRVGRFIENIFRLTQSVVMGLALVSSLPITAQTDSVPVDLEMGGKEPK